MLVYRCSIPWSTNTGARHSCSFFSSRATGPTAAYSSHCACPLASLKPLLFRCLSSLLPRGPLYAPCLHPSQPGEDEDDSKYAYNTDDGSEEGDGRPIDYGMANEMDL